MLTAFIVSFGKAIGQIRASMLEVYHKNRTDTCVMLCLSCLFFKSFGKGDDV